MCDGNYITTQLHYYTTDLGESLRAGKVEATFNSSILITVGTVNGILPNAGGELLTDRAFSRVGGVGRTDQRAEIGNGVVLFQDGGNNGATTHELDELAVKGTFGVDGVKLTGFFSAEFGVLHRYDLEASGVDLLENSTDVSVTDGVGLDHGEGAVGGHFSLVFVV